MAQEIDAYEQRRARSQVPKIEYLQIGNNETIVSEREITELHAFDARDPACDEAAGDAAQLRRFRSVVGWTALQQRIQQRRIAHGNFCARIDEGRSINTVDTAIECAQPARLPLNRYHGFVWPNDADTQETPGLSDRQFLMPKIESHATLVQSVETEIAISLQPLTRENGCLQSACGFGPEFQIVQANGFRFGTAGGAAEVVPVVVNGVMYISTQSKVVALDPENGKEIWSYEVEGGGASPRGVAYWPGDKQNSSRILFTAGHSMIALNSKTGKLDPGFAKEGILDMVVPYNGVPTIFRNIVMVGASTGEKEDGPPGNTRGYDARTGAKELEGLIIPVVVTVYSDRSFTFITKTPPAAILLKRAAGIAKGSGVPNKDKVGKVTLKQVEDIAKQKMPDLNAASVETAIKSIRGTARSMGIEVVG